MIQLSTNFWVSKDAIINCEVSKGKLYVRTYEDRLATVSEEYISTVCRTLDMPLNTILTEIEKSKG